MIEIGLGHYLTLGAIIFFLGVIGFLLLFGFRPILKILKLFMLGSSLIWLVIIGSIAFGIMIYVV